MPGARWMIGILLASSPMSGMAVARKLCLTESQDHGGHCHIRPHTGLETLPVFFSPTSQRKTDKDELNVPGTLQGILARVPRRQHQRTKLLCRHPRFISRRSRSQSLINWSSQVEIIATLNRRGCARVWLESSNTST